MHKLSYKELLTPIIYNEIGNLLPYTNLEKSHIKKWLKVYMKLHMAAQSNWNSVYKHIFDYESYVYLIHDIKYNKYYIGVRYTPNKFNTNLVEDLMQYKSSSTNKNFKKRMDENIDDFKLIVLKSFDNELDAKNYEALLHTILYVDDNVNFHNKTAAGFVSYTTYCTTLYNLKTNTICYYNDIKEYITPYDITNAITRKTLVFKGHYCLYDTVVESIQRYTLLNTAHILYKYNVLLQKIISYKIKYKDGNRVIGDGFALLIKGTSKSYNNYYTDKELCDFDCIPRYTVYWYNLLGRKLESITCSYNYCLDNKIPINTLLKDSVLSACGYYLDKEICLKDNQIQILYRYNVNHSIDEINFINVEGHRIVGKHYSELMDPNVAIYQSNGYYLTRENCIKNNRVFEFYNENEDRYLIVHMKDCIKQIGYKYLTLVYGTQETHKGWKFIREINPLT